jgi:predicted O-methyltransferase YrrM
MKRLSLFNTSKLSNDEYSNIVKSYYETTTKKGAGNKEVAFRSEWAIDKKSGEYIFNLVKHIEPDQTLEVGLAQGASTLHFLAALKFIQKGKHTAMDPLQSGFSDVGLAEMTRFGLDDRLRFFRERSDIVLPRLREQKELFQVCLIDGDHRFDAVFIDFYFIDKVLEIGGFIIFDEAGSGPTEKVISFIKNNLKNYEFQKGAPSRFRVLKKLDIDRRGWTDKFDF